MPSASNETRIANPSTPERQRFALSGRSVALDARRDAARRDIADIALAGKLFAPHYAVPEPRTCGLQAADILAAPAAAAARTSQLLPGETFCVVETSGGWAWGYSAHDHYVGYVAAPALGGRSEPDHVVTARAAPVFASDDIRAPLVAVLPFGARLAGRRDGAFIDIGQGHVHHRHVTAGDLAGVDPVALAETLIGAPYLWGGRGAGGIDCSGLVQLAYGLAGISLPRDSDQQARAGVELSGDPARGDLLVWADHIVIVRDAATVLHANSFHMAVVAEPLDDLIARAGPPIARRRVL